MTSDKNREALIMKWAPLLENLSQQQKDMTAIMLESQDMYFNSPSEKIYVNIDRVASEVIFTDGANKSWILEGPISVEPYEIPAGLHQKTEARIIWKKLIKQGFKVKE